MSGYRVDPAPVMGIELLVARAEPVPVESAWFEVKPEPLLPPGEIWVVQGDALVPLGRAARPKPSPPSHGVWQTAPVRGVGFGGPSYARFAAMMGERPSVFARPPLVDMRAGWRGYE